MIRITFMGFSCFYEPRLNVKIKKAVRKIIQSNDGDVEFYYLGQGYFDQICTVAVLLEKQYFKSRNVKLTFVGTQMEEFVVLPVCMFDEIIRVPCPNEVDVEAQQKLDNQLLLDAISKSDYLIAYVYEDMFVKRYNRLMTYARKQKKLKIVNLVDSETCGYLTDCIAHLSEQEQNVLHSLKAGYTDGELCKQLKFNKSQLTNILKNVQKQLHDKLYIRFMVNSKNTQPVQLTCGLVLLNPNDAADERLKCMFSSAVFFVDMYPAATAPAKFLVHSHFPVFYKEGFLKVLFDIREIAYPPNSKFFIEALTHYCYADIAEDEILNWLTSRYIPPFTSVRNVGASKSRRAANTEANHTLVNESDVIICNLSGTGYMDTRFKKYINKRDNVAVIDIGRNPDSVIYKDSF